MRLTNDLVLIRQIKDPEPRTAAGILLPPTPDSELTPYKGVVLFVGPGRRASVTDASLQIIASSRNLLNSADSVAGGLSPGPAWEELREALAELHSTPSRIPMEVAPGDVVIFSRHGHQEFKINGEILIGCAEASILGVLDPE